MSFTNPITNFRINDKWEVTADCADADGNIHTRSFNLSEYVGCDKEGILRSIYTEKDVIEPWDPSWPAPTITPDGKLTWNGPESKSLRPPTKAEMPEYINNLTGHYTLPKQDVETTTIVPVPTESGLFQQLAEILNKDDAILQYTTNPHQEGVTVFYAKAGVESEGHWFKSFTAEAKASIIELSTKTKAKVEQVEFSIIAAKAGVQFGSYVGADLSINLVVGKVSIFDAKLGIGISTGFGFRDEAVEVKALGCGFTVGKRIGISVFDNSFEINFGRFF